MVCDAMRKEAEGVLTKSQDWLGMYCKSALVVLELKRPWKHNY